MAKQDVAARIEDLLNEYLTGKELEIYNIEYRRKVRTGSFEFILISRLTVIQST